MSFESSTNKLCSGDFIIEWRKQNYIEYLFIKVLRLLELDLGCLYGESGESGNLGVNDEQ